MDVFRAQIHIDDLLTAQCKRFFQNGDFSAQVKAHMTSVCETSCLRIPIQDQFKIINVRGTALCVGANDLSTADTEEKILLATRGRF
jgi:hypothetical protein